MESLLLAILSEIKSNIKTPFALYDKHKKKIFGDNLKKNINEKSIRLINEDYNVRTCLPKDQLEDFCFFLRNIINTIYNKELVMFIQGKKSKLLSDFPFPCGLVLIQSDFIAEINGLMDTIFEKVMLTRIDDMLLFLIPLSNLEELKETSSALYQTIAEEVSRKATISIGGIAQSQAELTKAFSDAQNALQFASKKKYGVIYYPEMTLEFFISSLPSEIRHIYKNEMSVKLKSLDNDMINTIRVFFDSNLHIAETARRLYIHRNTLIYRLDKIQSITGLDLRNFKDAIKMSIYLVLNDFF